MKSISLFETLLEKSNPKALARTVKTAHQDQAFRETVKQAKLERMGLPGRAKQMALEVLTALETQIRF